MTLPPLMTISVFIVTDQWFLLLVASYYIVLFHGSLAGGGPGGVVFFAGVAKMLKLECLRQRC